MKVRIVFSRSKLKNPFFSKAIIWWDKKKNDSKLPISHISGKWHGKSWDRDFYYQASGSKTNFMGSALFNTEHETIEEYELELTPDIEKLIGQSCVDREGKPYAVKQTIGIALAGIWWLLTRKEIDNPFGDGDATTNCLEEWGRILALQCKCEYPGNLDQATPWLFRQWVASLPMAKKVENGSPI